MPSVINTSAAHRSKHHEWLPRAEKERRAAERHAIAAAEAPPPSKAQIRSKMRIQEGIGPPDAAHKASMAERRKSLSCDIGLTDPEEFERLVATSAAVRVRERPRSVEPRMEHNRHDRRLVSETNPTFPSRAGFIPADKGFSRTNSGGASLDTRRKSHEVERQMQVARTLESVKNSYFPRSKISMRT
jgi:hypothetical protein